MRWRGISLLSLLALPVLTLSAHADSILSGGTIQAADALASLGQSDDETGNALAAANGSSDVFIQGGQGNRVLWGPDSSPTFGPDPPSCGRILVRVNAPGNGTKSVGCDWNGIFSPGFIPWGDHGPTTPVPEVLNQTTPEPSTFLLFAAGLGLAGRAARKRQLSARLSAAGSRPETQE